MIPDMRRRVRLSATCWSMLIALAGCSSALREGAPSAAPAEVQRLRVIATNDFHGALLPGTPSFARGARVGGAAALAAHFDRARLPDRATLLVDGGDVMQGTLLSNLGFGRPTVEFYNAAGYHAAVIGNHEFDWGIDTLRARIAEAEFAWLGANIFVAGADTLPRWARPTAMVTLPGCAGPLACDSIRVGIVGIASEQTPSTTRPSMVATLTFGSEAAAIDRWVPRLRREGADFVVVVAHSGAFCEAPAYRENCRGEIVEVARSVRERPDLIVSGHTHSRVNTVVNGIPIVQAFSSGTAYSVVDLVRGADGRVALEAVVQPTAFVDSVTPDPRIAALVDRQAELIAPLANQVVGRVPEALRRRGPEYPLGNLIADSQRAATGTQVAIMNNGGIRADLDAGPVTYGQLFALQPFGNELVTMKLSGEQLLQVLSHSLGEGDRGVHVSGIRITRGGTAALPTIERVTLADGTPIRPQERYSLTVNNFLAEGGSGFAAFRAGAEIRYTGIVDLEALVRYFRAAAGAVPLPPANRLGVH